ncbi:hypothetical protein ACFX5D_04145 [Flavobacterium sp. LB3P45]|uniref:Transposase n=1 Tax=Flavobacterium fructosi TaxID=3230416 RepID=A0ABW6HJG1_9FLAO
MNVKLRIIAMLMRLQELEKERIESINNRLYRQFDNHSVMLTRHPTPEPLISLYDKKGRPLELPKSKYHK